MSRKRQRMTEQQKLWRRCQRRADATNERARQEIGPLFADQAPTVTTEDAYWKWRRNRAFAAESPCDDGQRGLKWIEVQALERFASGYLDSDDFAELRAYAHRLYKDPTYHNGFWRQVLTGERFSTQIGRNPDPNGRPAVIALRVCPREGWAAPFTRAEYDRLFPADRWDPRRVNADRDPFMTGDQWLDSWHVQRDPGVPIRWVALSLKKKGGAR